MGAITKFLAGTFLVSAVALGMQRREGPAPLRIGEQPTANNSWTASVASSGPVATTASLKPAPSPTVDKSPAMQEGRSKLLQKLINAGVFMKTGVPGSLPRVWVARGFYGLTFDQKQSFVGVVYAYYLDGSDKYDSVRVYDGYTNKEIGSMTTAGLTLR